MNKTILKTMAVLALTLLISVCPIKAQAAAQKAIGPVDILSITKYVEQDGWSWDPATKTLTLAGVYMDGYYECKKVTVKVSK